MQGEFVATLAKYEVRLHVIDEYDWSLFDVIQLARTRQTQIDIILTRNIFRVLLYDGPTVKQTARDIILSWRQDARTRTRACICYNIYTSLHTTI